MRKYEYADASSSIRGTMQCGVCGKKIVSGQYRYRQKSSKGDWHYVTHHRDCTKDDEMWLSLDAKKKAAEDRKVSLSNACIAFRKKWGVTELDDYIIDDNAIAAEGEK